MHSCQLSQLIGCHSRFIFWTHRAQLGFRFTNAKEQAILLGDLSHTVVHPFFIHFAHMFGCNIHLEQRRDYVNLQTLVFHIRSTLAALAEMSEDDPLLLAQACLLMTFACLYNHNTRLSRRYLHLTIGIVKRNDIRLVPRTPLHGMTDDPPLSYPEEVPERISFLINLMYSEVLLTHISGSAPVLLSDLWEQFEHELPVCSSLTHICFHLSLSYVVFTTDCLSCVVQKMSIYHTIRKSVVGYTRCGSAGFL